MDQAGKNYSQPGGVYDWLLEGDPAVVWQVMDLLAESDSKDIHLERLHIELKGWGKSLIDIQEEDGTWNNRAFTPKFSSTLWVLIALKRFGIYPLDIFKPAGLSLLENIQYTGSIIDPETKTEHVCLTGMVLGVLSYFKIEDKRRDALLDYLIETQQDDGSWNCFVDDEWHSPLVVTLAILEGLSENLKVNAKYGGIMKDLLRAGHNFLLEHKLFKDPRTDRILDMRYLSFPFPYFSGDILTMLDYFQSIDYPYDPNFEDAIEVLLSKGVDFRWVLNPLPPCNEMILFESPGDESRWNTLRAMRVIRWWRRVNKDKSLPTDILISSEVEPDMSQDKTDKTSEDPETPIDADQREDLPTSSEDNQLEIQNDDSHSKETDQTKSTKKEKPKPLIKQLEEESLDENPKTDADKD